MVQSVHMITEDSPRSGFHDGLENRLGGWTGRAGSEKMRLVSGCSTRMSMYVSGYGLTHKLPK